MSTVVVVKKNGKAVIAADSLWSFGETKVSQPYLHRRDKIFRLGDTYLATTGTSAHDHVLPHLFRHHKKEFSFAGENEIFETYLKMHSILKEKYFIQTTEEDNDAYESSQINALLANSHGIFGMYTWREVYEFERFWALGSGFEFAIGAMYAVYDRLETAEEIAVAAVQAACEFDNGSGLPLTLYATEIMPRKRAR